MQYLAFYITLPALFDSTKVGVILKTDWPAPLSLGSGIDQISEGI